jgi:hypothetical protein
MTPNKNQAEQFVCENVANTPLRSGVFSSTTPLATRHRGRRAPIFSLPQPRGYQKMKIEKDNNQLNGGRPLPPVIRKPTIPPRFNGARAQRLFLETNPRTVRKRTQSGARPLFALRRIWAIARPLLEAVRSAQAVMQGGLRTS